MLVPLTQHSDLAVSIRFEMITTISLATTCHHTKMLQLLTILLTVHNYMFIDIYIYIFIAIYSYIYS